MPEYDNALLSHADRTRMIADDHRQRLTYGAGGNFGTVLVDGFVGATWRIGRKDQGAVLVIRPVQPLTSQQSADVTEEGTRLLAFAAGDAASHDVQLVEPAC